MTTHSERLDRNERRNSLAAFLRTIKFRKPNSKGSATDSSDEPQLARLHPRTPQTGGFYEDQNCIRSAN